MGDRSDACEQAAKDAKVRAAKAEEEVADLVKKSQQLEVELDKTKEELMQTTEKLKEKENNLFSAELEVNALNRRVQGLEEDLEKCEDKLLQATNKLDKAATAADDSDRMRKVLENRAVQDEERMSKLEEELKSARNQAEEADKKYEEVQKRLQQVESELERAEERAETGEMKIIELEEELRVVASNLNPLKFQRRKPTKEKPATRNRSSLLLPSLSRLRLELSLLKDQSRNSRKRLTDWRMNLLENRKNTKLLQRNWKLPLQSALVIRFIFLFYCKKLLKPHKICLYKYLIICEK